MRLIPNKPLTSAMSFQLGPVSDSDSDSELPFPAPLAQDAFSSLHTAFSPHAFLASLRNRHQTLEDLRVELRTRSKDLESELVELVNRDYADFVGLGSSVKGGEGRVEDLKVGLLGFRREVEGIVAGIERTKLEVEKELAVKEGIRREKVLARNLLALAQRKLVGCWVYLDEILLPKIPKNHPFLKTQEERMTKVKDTLLIDLRSALKEVRLQGDEGKCLEVMGLFADLGAESDAVKALKETRR
ncbi:hypothetical protein K440DRAFT_198123 [Wilcoxina mikolae CBS 423.85]|nr:hypothetical protein K440DRAFT_198123 [Wilcoxina mikolae CBS 423.85]